jgi:hypothetical protein
LPFAIFKNIFLFLAVGAVGSENQFYLSFDMPLREHIEQRGFCEPYPRSFIVTYPKIRLRHLLFFINIFLFLTVGSENQFNLSFDMPLREHIEQRGLSK